MIEGLLHVFSYFCAKADVINNLNLLFSIII